MENKFVDVCDTMVSTKECIKNVKYIVLKIGDKTYSINSNHFIPEANPDVNISKVQKTTTLNVGTQENFWIKGVFTEEKNHEKIRPIPFELNIYSDIKERQGTL
jgi:hypothetical protein